MMRIFITMFVISVRDIISHKNIKEYVKTVIPSALTKQHV